MTPVSAASSDREFMDEFDRVQGSLYTKLAALEDAPTTGSSKAFISKAYDYIDATRSLDTLYVYDRLMFVQPANVYRLFLLNSAMKFVRDAVDGQINTVFTQEHVDRLGNFEFITSKHQSDGLFPDVADHKQQVSYLDTMRAAFVLGDKDACDYIEGNFDPVCEAIVHRDIRDPKLLLEVINGMKDGSIALVDGTL